MSESKPFGQLSNAWPKVRRQPFQSQHELMLTWIEPGVPHRLLAEVHQKSNLVTQFSQRPVITKCECGFHLDYVLASSKYRSEVRAISAIHERIPPAYIRPISLLLASLLAGGIIDHGLGGNLSNKSISWNDIYFNPHKSWSPDLHPGPVTPNANQTIAFTMRATKSHFRVRCIFRQKLRIGSPVTVMIDLRHSVPGRMLKKYAALRMI